MAYGKKSQGPASRIVKSEEHFSFAISERINHLFILISKMKIKIFLPLLEGVTETMELNSLI